MEGDVIGYDGEKRSAQIVKIVADDREELLKTGCDYWGVYLLVDSNSSEGVEYWDLESFFDVDVYFKNRSPVPSEWENFWEKMGMNDQYS